MQMRPQRGKYWFKNSVYLGLVMFFIPLGIGCASIHRTRTTKAHSREAAAKENAKFKHDGKVFNNDANKEIRAEKLAEADAAKTKDKTEEIQDKGEGQVNVKF